MLATVNGMRLFFDVEGAGLVPSGTAMVDKAPCFVLHGGPGMDHSYFKPWLSPLVDDLQLIYVDHRGTGRSERVPLESCTIEQMADDIEALRNVLGLGKVLVMGNSYGGMWAQVYALRYPESLSHLILVSTSPSHEFKQGADRELERKGTDEQKSIASHLFEGKVTTEEDFRHWWEVMLPLYFHRWDAKIGAEMIQRGVDNPLVAAYMFEHIIPKYDVRPQLATLRLPTLVTAGRHDWVTPVAESEVIASLVPNAELVVFEESGHMPFIEEQLKFADVVRRFVTTAA